MNRAARTLSIAARAVSSGRDIRPEPHSMRRTTVDVRDGVLVVVHHPLVCFLPSCSVRVPFDDGLLRDRPPSDPALASVLRSTALRLIECRRGEGRPGGPARLARELAPHCSHLPHGDIVVAAPCCTRPAVVSITSGAVPPRHVVDAVLHCEHALRVAVETSARRGRGGRDLVEITITAVEARASTAVDPVAYIRSLADRHVHTAQRAVATDDTKGKGPDPRSGPYGMRN